MARMRPRTVEERLFRPGPKRILALDGAGQRSFVTLGILAELERRIGRRAWRPNFRLCDYFDLIGGSSTGAVTAAALAVGKSVAEAAQLHRRLSPFWAADAAGKGEPNAAELHEALAEEFGAERLDSPVLKTGFAAFAKRLDQPGAWMVSNNPRSRLWTPSATEAAPHSESLVHRVAAACSSAPISGRPVNVALAADGPQLAFADAACAALSSPALQLLRVATLSGYGFSWMTGHDRLLLLSIGAGFARSPASADPTRFTAVAGAAAQADLVTLQGLTRTLRPWRIDAELGDMTGMELSPVPIAHFQRMDVRLEPDEFARLDLPFEADLVRGDAPPSEETEIRFFELGLRAGQSYFTSAAGDPQRNWDREILPPRFDPQEFRDRPLGPPKIRLEAMGRLAKRKPAE
jgi:hypothetical protein